MTGVAALGTDPSTINTRRKIEFVMLMCEVDRRRHVTGRDIKRILGSIAKL